MTHKEIVDSITDIIKCLSSLAWPAVALIALIVLQKEVKELLRSLTNSSSKFSIPGGLAFEITKVQDAYQRESSSLLADSSSADEKVKRLRALEVAKQSAERFVEWRRKYNHSRWPSDSMKLLEWLVADRGADYIAYDYSAFQAMAEILNGAGYNTLPVPGENEFNVRCEEARAMSRSMIRR
jgi:hypothetical protein